MKFATWLENDDAMGGIAGLLNLQAGMSQAEQALPEEYHDESNT